MGGEGRPGPKPKRLYARVVRWGDPDRDDLPNGRECHRFAASLETSGRLVAQGRLTEPSGDLLVFRARDRAEAERVLRTDPLRALPDSSFEILVWDPAVRGTGVNLDPPPARGSGRLTRLERVAVVVRDRASSLAWYRGVLGLEVRDEDEETGFVELSLGNGVVAVSLVVPRPEWGEPFYSEALARIGSRTGIVFETDSVDALALRLENAGTRLPAPAHVEPWGGRTIRFTDPDGNEFLAFETHRASGGRSPSARTTSAKKGRAPKRL
ncbi:MAG: VOC family protein [Thermoplasmata archaeon]|nr:VOC family protein [Thermoplasmata archaeon]